MEDKYYSVTEVAKKYGVSKSAVTKWIRENKLKAVRLGNVWRIPESALLEFIRSHECRGQASDKQEGSF